MLSLGHANYWIYVVIMMIGFYGVIARHNMVKKVISLGIFQTGIFLLYISMGVIEGGVAPIHVDDPNAVYTNPIPHVLILTAIVVSLAITSVALAIIVNIKKEYGTIEADEVYLADLEEETPQTGFEPPQPQPAMEESLT